MELDLTTLRCEDLPKGSPSLTPEQIEDLGRQLAADWQATGDRLSRRFKVEGYPAAHMLANAAAFLAEREGHHPDICFGWGWCEVTWWTHTVGGLSMNDFICAAKLDALVTG